MGGVHLSFPPCPAGEPDSSILTRLDKLSEDAATLRVGLVLGIHSSLSDDEDEVE